MKDKGVPGTEDREGHCAPPSKPSKCSVAILCIPNRQRAASIGWILVYPFFLQVTDMGDFGGYD
ncbi:hypothetical protein I79_001530 [Cricetulus griseus]|uniref:Uncharacterized protein n=1 Tax=Cricetulus griseus TaxID=10029 RepID=G3GV04_CRIGR|nr:hypothetical protein I79_001530 [Cricetulus griseus]